MAFRLLNIFWLINLFIVNTYSKVTYHKGYRCESPPVPCELIPHVYEPGPCFVSYFEDKEGINVVFLVHVSQTVPLKNIQLMRSIVKNMVTNVTMSYSVDHLHYETLTMCLFSASAEFVHKEWGRLTLSEKLIDESINATQLEENSTLISDAFNKVEETLPYFWRHKDYAPNLCVLLTASSPDNTSLAAAAAKSLRDSGVTIIVIAVGDNVETKDVENLASNKNVVFTAGKNMSDSVEEIEEDGHNLASAVMTVWRSGYVLPRYKSCHNAYINFFIVIDVSEDHIQTLSELRKFVIKFNFDHVLMRIMIINTPVSDKKYMDSFKSIVRAIRRVKFETFDSKYNLLSGVSRGRHVLQEIARTEKKTLHEKIIILATDKALWNIDDVISETRENREAGIHVMALGIGNEIMEQHLSLIATDPWGLATVKSLSYLSYGLEKLNRNLCPPVCEDRWHYHDGMCYYPGYSKMSWLGAQKYCRERNSKLVSITSAEKYAWLKSEFLDKRATPRLIGLRKHRYDISPISSEFRWENGKPLAFSDWYNGTVPSEPDNAAYEECAKWQPEGWRDVLCTSTQIYGSGFICEKEAGNASTHHQTVKILPLWQENACELPQKYTTQSQEPIMVNSQDCRPVLDVHMEYDPSSFYRCQNGELISKYLHCDGLEHCLDGSDEMNCSPECGEDQFTCKNGRCVSLAYFCDFWDDCGDNSDEADCVIGSCSSEDEWQCDSGQCIPRDSRCDLLYDCFDRSDEECSDVPCRFKKCPDGTCIPWSWYSDGDVDCAGGLNADENGGSWNVGDDICYTGRYKDLFYLFANEKYINDRPDCCLVFDGYGKRLGNWKDPKCTGDNVTCPIGFYRCPSSYCIPIERVCDGVMDCPDGEEEVGCVNFECPGYFRCPGVKSCHHPARVCDGDPDCPSGKDETLCDFMCPNKCTCSAAFVECGNMLINGSIPLDPRTRKLVVMDSSLLTEGLAYSHMIYLMELKISGIGLTSLQNMFKDLNNLRVVNISQNYLTEIPVHVFSGLGKMKILDVSYNPLRKIYTESFAGLKLLEELYLKYTSIEILEQESFLPLSNLKILDVRGNTIRRISDDAFHGLIVLKSLHMQGNPITKFGLRVYEGLQSLAEIHTDIHNLCCPQVRSRYLHETKCTAPKLSISSCSDLLASDILRSSIWVLCIASLIGNVASTVMRLVWERGSMRNGFGVFVTHLGISDFLMGIYLLIIAVADIKYKGTYIWHDHDWRNSVYCKIAGALATISSEASALFICLITLDRFLIIKFPFGQLKFRYKSATSTSLVVWLFAVTIAVIPLFPSVENWNFYGKNGACLALPYSTERKPGWIYSALIFIGLNFVAFIFIGLGQMSIYRAMKEGSMVTSEERRARELAVARRLFLIVATDFICWFPIGVMSVLALSGISVGGEVYAWTAVFVLPVNSALNPILYTIPAVMKRLKNSKKDSKMSSITETSRVEVSEPDSSLVLLEDVFLQLDSKEDRLKLLQIVLTEVMEFLKSLKFDNTLPNSIYIGMQGKVVERICLSTKTDSSSDGIITELISLVNTQKRQPEGRSEMRNDGVRY